MSQSTATSAPVNSRTADSIIIEAIDARRDGIRIRPLWENATGAQRSAITRRIKALAGASVWDAKRCPMARFEEFIGQCVYGETVSFPEPAPASPIGWTEIEADDPAPSIADPIDAPTTPGDESPAPVSGGSPDAEMVVATSDPADFASRPLASLNSTRVGTPADRDMISWGRSKADWLASCFVDHAMAAVGRLRSSESAFRDYPGFMVSPKAKDEFLRFLDIMACYPAFEGCETADDFAEVDIIDHWRAFIRLCITGSPVSFPAPIDPGPDGRPSDLDLSAFVVATETHGSSYAVHRFPGGFELRALDLAPLVIVYTALGQPWHRIDTASVPTPVRPLPTFLGSGAIPPAPIFPGAPLTIEIKGRPYGLTCTRDGFILEKPDGTQYDVAAGLLGWSCSCPDQRLRRSGNDSLGCKHIRALRAQGIIRGGESVDIPGVETHTPGEITPMRSDLATTPEIDRLIKEDAPVAIGVSGGKDSVAAAFATLAHLDRVGHRGPRVLIHSDLGRVEWKDSGPTCERLAQATGTELLTVRRQAGDMMDRWLGRWSNNVDRYRDLSCVQLILPWSTPSMRFCTSELKTDIICRALVRRFPGRDILSVSGIRREESANRAKAPVAKSQPKLTSTTHKTSGLDWHPIIEYSLEEVLEVARARDFRQHEAYTEFGSSRVSCAFCIMSASADILAAAGCEDNQDLYREMVALEARSSFAFQGGKWLGDAAPHLLTPDLALALTKAKEAGERRQRAEARIPKHLLYTKGWPTCIPTWEEAELLASVRRGVAEAVGLDIRYTDAASIIGRYEELMAAKPIAKATT